MLTDQSLQGHLAPVRGDVGEQPQQPQQLETLFKRTSHQLNRPWTAVTIMVTNQVAGESLSQVWLFGSDLLAQSELILLNILRSGDPAEPPEEIKKNL